MARTKKAESTGGSSRVSIGRKAHPKAILKAIDSWARAQTTILPSGGHAGGPAVDLWTILTALRGPDEASRMPEKATSTAIIRRDTVPNLAKKAYADVAWPDSQFGATTFAVERSPRYGNNHFYIHATKAKDVLDRWASEKAAGR